MFLGFGRAQVVILALIIFLGACTVWLAYGSAQVSASNQKRLADIEQLQVVMNIFFKENGYYPYGQGTPNNFEPYLNSWPTPPKPTGSCTNQPNLYYYTPQSSGDDYSIMFCLGTSTGGLRAGIHNASSKGIQ